MKTASFFIYKGSGRISIARYEPRFELPLLSRPGARVVVQLG